MYRLSPTAWRIVAVAAGATLLSSACRKRSEAGRAERAAAACEKLCRLVVRSSDARPEGQCHRGCMAQLSAAGSACEPMALKWLECRANAARPFETPKGSAPAPAADSCGVELSLAKDCAKDCRRDGILQSGEQTLTDRGSAQQVSFEARYYGCSSCVIDSGAPQGAACTSPKICAAKCFACRSQRGAVGLRACVDGHCASTAELGGLLQRLDMLAPCGQ